MVGRRSHIMVTLAWLLVGCVTSYRSPTLQQSARVSLQVQTPGNTGGGWRALDPGETLNTGDHFAMRVEVDQPAHVYVVRVSPKGASTPLWPTGQDALARP